MPSDEDLRTYLKDANAYILKGMVKLFFERYENIDNNTPIIDFSA